MIESNVPDLIQTTMNENNNSNLHPYASYLNPNGLNNESIQTRWNDHYAACYGSADNYYRNLQYSNQPSKLNWKLFLHQIYLSIL
jgi:hypothetical protein